MRKYLLIILVAALYSCAEFIKPKSQSEYIPKTTQAIEEMLIGSAYSNGNTDIFSDLNFHDDDIAMTAEAVGFTDEVAYRRAGYYALYSKSKTRYVDMKNSSMSNNTWFDTYERIMGANAALDYIDDVEGTDEEKSNVRAQAYALRAFYHFHLVNLYGAPYNFNKDALGVPIKLTSKYDDNFLTRSSVGEVYEQIVADLIKAEECYNTIPKEKQFMKNYRLSLPAVQLLLSRVYLYMDNMTMAAKYAEKVIKDWGFKLYDLNTFTKTEEVLCPDYVTYDNPETIWAYGSHSNLNKYSYFIGSDAEDYWNRYPLFRASDELFATYGEGDIRREAYFISDGKSYTEFLPMSKGKYKLEWGEFMILTTNMGLSFRLSEAYLNFAEATVASNPTAAINVLNELREKRFSQENYTAISGISGQMLKDVVYEERRRELCFEGHRWFDLRRQGMKSFTRKWNEYGEAKETFTIGEKSPYFTLPIDQEVIDNNPNIKPNSYN